MRAGEKRGPLVEEDMLALPVVAAGDCHIAQGRMGSVMSRTTDHSCEGNCVRRDE